MGNPFKEFTEKCQEIRKRKPSNEIVQKINDWVKEHEKIDTQLGFPRIIEDSDEE